MSLTGFTNGGALPLSYYTQKLMAWNKYSHLPSEMNRMEDIGSYGKNDEYLGEMTRVCQGECLFIMPSAPQIEMDGVEQRLMGRDGGLNVWSSPWIRFNEKGSITSWENQW